MTSHSSPQLFQHLATPLTFAPPFHLLSCKFSLQTINLLPLVKKKKKVFNMLRVKTLLLLWHLLSEKRGGEAQQGFGEGWVRLSG